MVEDYHSGRKTLNKDQWIQKAKALLFDCIFCVDADSIKQEIRDLLEKGGGYDARVENSDSSLRWPEQSS